MVPWGTSGKGLELLGLELYAGPANEAERPLFKYVGNVHGDEPSGRQLLLALAVAAAQLPPPLLHGGCWGGAGGSTSSLECSSEEPDSTSSQLRSQMAWRGRESMGEKYWRGSSCTRRTGCSACPLGRNPTAFERALKASHLVNTRAAHLARPNRLEKGVLEQLPGLGAQLGVVADTELDELTRLVVRHLAQAAGEHAL